MINGTGRTIPSIPNSLPNTVPSMRQLKGGEEPSKGVVKNRKWWTLSRPWRWIFTTPNPLRGRSSSWPGFIECPSSVTLFRLAAGIEPTCTLPGFTPCTSVNRHIQSRPYHRNCPQPTFSHTHPCKDEQHYRVGGKCSDKRAKQASFRYLALSSTLCATSEDVGDLLAPPSENVRPNPLRSEGFTRRHHPSSVTRPTRWL